MRRLIPHIQAGRDDKHLRRSVEHYGDARKGLDELATGKAGRALHPQHVARVISLCLVHRPFKAAALQAMVFGMPAIAFTGLAILTPLIGDKATVVVDFAGLAANILILPATLVLLAFVQDGGGGQAPERAGHGKGGERAKDRSMGATVTKPCGKRCSSLSCCPP